MGSQQKAKSNGLNDSIGGISRVMDRVSQSGAWNHKRNFNGTLYTGILDQLVCSACGKNLTYGFICKFNTKEWRWRVLCDNCRYLHLEYEISFIRFKQS